MRFKEELARKEKDPHLRSTVLKVPSGDMPQGYYTVRVFSDGTAYALDGLGGRYIKYVGTGVWDYNSPDGTPYSRADEQYASVNKLISDAWRGLQDEGE